MTSKGRRNVRGGRLLAAALALMLVGMLWPLGAEAQDALARVKQSGLNVCAVDGLLPYSSSDAKTPGFEVEIARAIGKEIGAARIEHVWVTWDALIPALTSKRCDAIIDGMFITDERKKVVDFSAPYYGSGETILVRKDNTTIKKLDDLKGKKTGVLSGSVTVQFLEKKGIGPLAVYPDQNTIIIELNNGRIDAAYLEAPSAAWAIQKDPKLNVRVVKEYVPEERFNAGVAVRKEDAALLQAINTAVPKLVSSGEIDRIMARYGVPFFPAK